MIGCDGIYEVKSNQEIIDFVKERFDTDYLKEGKPLTAICGALMDSLLSPDISATEGLGCDNMTMMIVDLKKDKRG